MARIGYARVSTRDQHPEQQKRALLAEGCAEDDIFTDHGASGAKASRPEWDRCLAHLRKGDVLVVTRIDRVGRSLINLLDVVNLLKERGAQLKVLDQPDLDTTSRNGRLVFSILGALAEWERAIIAERTREGLAEAKVRHGGKLPGRKPSLSPDKIKIAQELMDKRDENGLSATRVAEIVGTSRATLFRHVTVNREDG
jgi:DNA invertase Pin-like site-specific DNA recombinase